MFLSIIIPAHNEAQRLPVSLQQIDEFLSQQAYDYEVIVVENGSSDNTADVVRSFMAKMPYLRLIESDKRGKGLAVQDGMLAANGTWRFMADADLSMPIEELAKFLPPTLDNFDIAIGSREAPGAKRYNEPAFTHFRGRVFNKVIKWFALPDYEDTQCGFKCFHKDAAADLFAVQTLSGMSFDVELLFVAKQRGYKTHEIPINWYFDPDSKVRMIEDSLAMFGDILTIRRNWRNGAYKLRSA